MKLVRLVPLLALVLAPLPAGAQSASPSPAMPMASAPSSPAAMPMASAKPKPAATPPQLVVKSADLAPLRYLIGAWSCKITASSSPAAAVVGRTFSIVFATEFDGTWIEGGSYAKSGKSAKLRLTSRNSFSYDPLVKKAVFIQVGSGGSYDVATAPALTGPTITWTESTDTADGLHRWTVLWKKLGPKAIEFDYAGPIDQQNTSGTSTTVCKKT